MHKAKKSGSKQRRSNQVLLSLIRCWTGNPASLVSLKCAHASRSFQTDSRSYWVEWSVHHRRELRLVIHVLSMVVVGLTSRRCSSPCLQHCGVRCTWIIIDLFYYVNHKVLLNIVRYRLHIDIGCNPYIAPDFWLKVTNSNMRLWRLNAATTDRCASVNLIRSFSKTILKYK